LQVEDKKYLLDDQGFVIKELFDNSSNLLVITDQVNESIKVGSMIDGKLVPFILSMQKAWPEKTHLKIESAKIPGKGAAEVEFVSSEGWSVFFTTERSVAAQLDNLETIINRQIPSSDRSKLAYVDLRLSKWAYYCYKDTPCQQTDQADLGNANVPDSTSGASTTTNSLNIQPPPSTVIQPQKTINKN
jgi:hypothetical protein